jgi:hypothetical protein
VPQYEISIARNGRTGKPTEIVAWKVAAGTAEQVQAWPATDTGRAWAGQWAVVNRAGWRVDGTRIRAVKDLTTHPNAT